MKKPARRPVFSYRIQKLLGGGRFRGSGGVGSRSGGVGGRSFGSGGVGGRSFHRGSGFRSRSFSGRCFSGSGGFFLLTASGHGNSQQSSQENGIFHLISL